MSTNLKQKNNQQGFAVLYAVLVAGVVSIGGLLLSNIIFKQLVLTNVGQNSQIAYYAADVGRYCAKYWRTKFYFGEVLDLNDDGFLELDFGSQPEIQPYCLGQDVPLEEWVEGDRSSDEATWSFTIPNIEGKSCAKVTVKNSVTSYEATSLGYNNNTCRKNDQRLVLRRVSDYGNNSI